MYARAGLQKFIQCGLLSTSGYFELHCKVRRTAVLPSSAMSPVLELKVPPAAAQPQLDD